MMSKTRTETTKQERKRQFRNDAYCEEEPFELFVSPEIKKRFDLNCRTTPEFLAEDFAVSQGEEPLPPEDAARDVEVHLGKPKSQRQPRNYYK